MNYVIYCRKSSESADRQVLSIDAQERELSELAIKRNLVVVKVFKESQSAKDTGRPVFAEMMVYIQKGHAQGILAWKLDRLARNFVDAGLVMDMLGKSTIRQICTFERDYLPTDNVLMPSVEFGMANQYVKELSVNVKRGNRQKLERGEWPNHPPFGYLNDPTTKKIIIDESKEYYVRKAFDLFASGTKSYLEISNLLYTEGLRTKHGKKVYRSIFQRMMYNPFYMGIMERHGKYYQGNHTPLITADTFNQVKEVMLYGSRPRAQKLFFPLRGFMSCASCGCALTATQAKGHHYYYCTNGKGICNQHKTYMREINLYPLVESIFDELHFDEELIEIMYQAARERAHIQADCSEDIIKGMESTLESLRSKESKLLDSYLANHIPQALYEEKMRDIGNQRTVAIKQLAEVKQKGVSAISTLEPVKKVFLDCSRAKKEFSEADDAKKQLILEKLLSNLSIKDKKIVSYQYKMPFAVLAKTPKTGAFTGLLRD